MNKHQLIIELFLCGNDRESATTEPKLICVFKVILVNISAYDRASLTEHLYRCFSDFFYFGR